MKYLKDFLKALLIAMIMVTVVVIANETVNGQSIGIPDWQPQVSVGYSAQIWGKLPNTGKITASYGMIQVAYFNGFKTYFDGKNALKHSTKIRYGDMAVDVLEKGYSLSDFTYGGSYIAVFINPLQFKWNGLEITGGVGWFFQKFPDIAGRNLHFQLSIRYMITDDIGVSWSHVSSGFKIWNQMNPGVDALSLVIEL